MQFKNPEVLYFLALLLIPILVHLFQLQKFVKVPFTNVAFLQKLQQQTRNSSRIKKWLILTTRLLLFLAILFAFSQPYFSNKNINKKQHTFIYLDNSLSTNTKGEKGNLLKIAAQEVIENTEDKNNYSLLTNTDFYKNISKKTLKDVLLKIENTPKKLDLNTIYLKINQENKIKTNTLNKNILISDFQFNKNNKFTNVTPVFSAIQLKPAVKNNISIDSVFITNTNNANFMVNVVVKNEGAKINNVPIAIFNKETLISKQTFPIEKDNKKTITFTVQNSPSFLGKISITFSDTFSFDNDYYFTLNKQQKTNVLAIGNNLNFLSKIYSEKEFNFSDVSLLNVNYNAIENQQLIILNELENIPEILSKSLQKFSKNGCSIVLIPNKKIALNSYNLFLKNLNLGSLKNQIVDTLKITTINYNHPIFENVFSKKVTNFQYPNLKSHYPISGNNSKLISLENSNSFISELKNNFYYVSGAINKENSNFLNSPLIVPVFYNFGKMSFQYPKLSYVIDQENTIEIETKIGKDEILKIANNKESFIPLQKTYQNKVALFTKEQPINPGFYTVLKDEKNLQTLAFNYPKEESILQYLDLNILKKDNSKIKTSTSIKDVFTEINKNNKVQWLWKWFLALAIVSLLLEILILKFYKP